MRQAAEEIAKQFSSAAGNKKAWYGVIFNVLDPAYGAKGDGETDDTSAFQKAINACFDNGGGVVFAPAGKYVITSNLLMKSGVYLEGAGNGQWEPIFPTRPKTWEGTSLLFRGTGVKSRTFPGVTSMRYAGGWREDPDNAGQYFKLTSFMNDDASGNLPATPRLFSAAIAPEEGAMYWGISNMRIVPWKGADGYSAYSDRNDPSLSDPWDIGILLVNTEYAQIEDVQVVGEWREFAILNITPGLVTDGRSEQNRIDRCKLQGRIGLGIRSADRWEVQNTTSSTVEIYWSNELYWPSSGSFRGSDNQTYTYTGVSRSGTTFTFTGVTPNPSGIFQVRNPRAGTGFANSLVKDVYAYGLDHVNGQTADFYGIHDSKPLEMSGFPLRGVSFYNFKAHTREKVISFLHDAADPVFIDPQFEGGGFVIASPFALDATYAVAPTGETRNIVMIADHGMDDQVDLRLFLPRTGFIQGLQVAPRGDLSGDFLITAMREGKDTIIVTKNGQNFRVRGSDGETAIRVTDMGNVIIENGGQLTLSGGTAFLNADGSANIQIRNGTTTRFQVFGNSGNVGPGSDNLQSMGTSGLRWSTIYAGTGTINTSDRDEKQQVQSIPDAVLDAWAEVNYCRFKYNEAVDKKGTGARWHIGLIAQEIKEIFEAHGLDATEYGLLCYDEWDDDSDNGIIAGNRWGIRPDECQFLEIALMRREIDRIKSNS